MAAFYFGSDNGSDWEAECGKNGDGCAKCGGKCAPNACAVFDDAPAPFIKGQRVISLAVNVHGRRGIVTTVYEGVGSYAVRVRFDGDSFSRDHATEFLQDEGDYDAQQQRKAEEAAAQPVEDGETVCQGCGLSDALIPASDYPEMAGWCERCQAWGNLPFDDSADVYSGGDWAEVAAEYDRTVEEADFDRYADYMLPFRLSPGEVAKVEEEPQAGRLCGDCMRPIPVGSPAVFHATGRHYHPTCSVGKVLFGDLLQRG